MVHAMSRSPAFTVFIGWLRVELSVEKPGQMLEIFATLDTNAFVAEVRKRLPKGAGRSTPAALKVRACA